jgi:CO/xanthine dehydrogenase Mo-binding subunit
MAADETPQYKIIGHAVPRHDARDKVFGNTKYADDFVMPGTLWAKVLRSEYAAARIVSIDTGKAEAMPGVRAVLTAQDVPNNETTSKFGQTHAAGGGFEGLYRVLAAGKVRYMGEAVALVAAETLAEAEAAARAIEVVYDPQPGVFDPVEARMVSTPSSSIQAVPDSGSRNTWSPKGTRYSPSTTTSACAKPVSTSPLRTL